MIPSMPRIARIVGDGPAALVAGTVLARCGWRVTLTGRQRRRPRSGRIDLLGGSALATLSRLGITQSDVSTVAKECPGTLSLWDGHGPHGHDYLTTLHGSAWAVDRAALEALLGRRAEDAGVVRTFSDCLSISGSETSAPYQDVPGEGWCILASGRLGVRSRLFGGSAYDDRLIAIVAVGEIDHSRPVDGRLIIEATEDGWAYAIAGHKNRMCIAVVTDAQELSGQTPRGFALRTIEKTDQIARIADRLRQPVLFQAVPVPCRWLPFNAGPGILRIGDAQVSFDPLSGRGLWEAIRRSEEVALALDSRIGELRLLEAKSRSAYRRYLTERLGYYRSARDRFGTDFWSRRLRERPSRPSQPGGELAPPPF